MAGEDYHIRVKELPGTQRPREKLIKYGPDTLKNSELLAIVLNTGYRGLNVLELSRMIIHRLLPGYTIVLLRAAGKPAWSRYQTRL